MRGWALIRIGNLPTKLWGEWEVLTVYLIRVLRPFLIPPASRILRRNDAICDLPSCSRFSLWSRFRSPHNGTERKRCHGNEYSRDPPAYSTILRMRDALCAWSWNTNPPPPLNALHTTAVSIVFLIVETTSRDQLLLFAALLIPVGSKTQCLTKSYQTITLERGLCRFIVHDVQDSRIIATRNTPGCSKLIHDTSY